MNSDVQIAGDPLALPHLLPPVPAHPHTVAGFAGLARSIAADRTAWAPLVRYDATTRWYHRLRTIPARTGAAGAAGEGGTAGEGGAASLGYEVWLLSWVPGQGSGRHDHGVSSGVLTVLEGELTEHGGTTGPRTLTAGAAGPRTLTAGAARPRTLTAGAQRVFAPGYVHEIVNDSLRPAVSLHIYFPGLTDMPMHPSRRTTAGTAGIAVAAPEILAP
ncbi:cysteine dioxygenase [Streptomyces sp. NPDC001339]|uniref:cysteine dioxygenase n=1 Tax=Streptomyces sp. NPDC001339 TaxID=3364563 RepID=UPI0036A172A5